MRGTRWLLLVAIAAILSGITYKYRLTQQALTAAATPAPAPLDPGLNNKSQHWQVVEKNHATGRKLYEIDAEEFKQSSADSHVELKNVAMKLFAKDEKTYNLVKSAAANYDPATGGLFSQGDTEITIGMPLEGVPSKDLTVIRTSGVAFDKNTGKADTDKPSTFVFDRGDGKSTGASYDPETHELQMKHDVEVHWKPSRPGAKPALIEGASLSYHESTSEIWLKPWGRVTRENSTVEGTDAVIKLDKHVIHSMTALQAHGSEDAPARKLTYAADELAVEFNEHGIARKVSANKNAQLVSTTPSTETTVNAGRVELALQPEGHDAVLTGITANGNAVVTSKPVAAPGRQLSETHILRSDSLTMKMRPGGREVETLVAAAPGQLEFIPNMPSQHHRTLDGKDFVIAYGPQNRVDNFHAKDVRTTTEPTADEKKRSRVASVTTSRAIEVKFGARNGVSSIKQSGDFTYEEGDRRARAATATLDGDHSVIDLDTGARMNDATGSTTADRIHMDERTGDFTADGNVMSSRLPEKDQKKNSEMLSGDDPVQATARRMDSRNRNRAIHYEGGVNLWQGANRIQAETVDINRDQDKSKRSLIADGHVVTTLWESNKDDSKGASAAPPSVPGPSTAGAGKDIKAPKKPSAPVLTETRAGHMVYTEQERLTHYTGGVVLNRPGMTVKSKELKAYLAESGSGSSVEKAFADGAVEIFSQAKDRTRRGTGEHAEYYPGDQKVILRGPWVKMVEQIAKEPRPRTTEGTELTYWANDDRMVETGTPEKPAETHFTRTKKGK